jgi:hypothetical protein
MQLGNKPSEASEVVEVNVSSVSNESDNLGRQANSAK